MYQVRFIVCVQKTGGPGSSRRPLPTVLRLESVAKTDGRLGAMGYAIGALHRDQTISRAIVDEPAILGANEELLGDVEVGARAINEPCSRLRRGSGSIPGIEDQGAGATLHKWSEAAHLVPEDVSRTH